MSYLKTYPPEWDYEEEKTCRHCDIPLPDTNKSGYCSNDCWNADQL